MNININKDIKFYCNKNTLIKLHSYQKTIDHYQTFGKSPNPIDIFFDVVLDTNRTTNETSYVNVLDAPAFLDEELADGEVEMWVGGLDGSSISHDDALFIGIANI